MKSLAGKIAVITGAGGGIGRCLAQELARRGCDLALLDISTEGLAETQKLCEPTGRTVRTYRVDVANREQVYATAEQVVKEFGRVNLVVNNAGVELGGTALETSLEDFEWMMNINFWGVIYGTQAFLPHLIQSGDGHLVNISSMAGFIAVPKQSAYCASKFAVRGYTEALRQEMLVEKHPVEVSCVHPGVVRTNLARAARVSDAEDKDAQIQNFERMARTTPEQAAKVIVRGILANRPRITIGADGWLSEKLPRILGASYQRLSAAYFKKLFNNS
jgi:short-subunit dehydrogenase